MIGEKSGKVLKDSAAHSNYSHVSGKEPLVERVKRRTRGIGKKVMFAGLVGLSALMFRPAIVTAQQVAMNTPSGERTEQNEKYVHNYCEITLDQIKQRMIKETDENTINTMKAILDEIETGKRIMVGQDTIMGAVGGRVADFTMTEGGKETARNYIPGITDQEFNKSVEAGGIKFLLMRMDEKKTDLAVQLCILNGDKITSKKNDINGSNIIISFLDKNDKNISYTSVLKCPDGCEFAHIIPFFGQIQGSTIQFGVYMRYIQEGKEYQMVSYILYNPLKKRSTTIYFIREYKQGDISSVSVAYLQ